MTRAAMFELKRSDGKLKSEGSEFWTVQGAKLFRTQNSTTIARTVAALYRIGISHHDAVILDRDSLNEGLEKALLFKHRSFSEKTR
jgi:hypothetical protein